MYIYILRVTTFYIYIYIYINNIYYYSAQYLKVELYIIILIKQ